jgi:hypothetical protein
MMALTELIAADAMRDEDEKREQLKMPTCGQQEVSANEYPYECTRTYEHDGPHVAGTYVTPIESLAHHGYPLTVYVIAAVWPR